MDRSRIAHRIALVLVMLLLSVLVAGCGSTPEPQLARPTATIEQPPSAEPTSADLPEPTRASPGDPAPEATVAEQPSPVPTSATEEEPAFTGDLSQLGILVADIEGVPHCSVDQAQYSESGSNPLDPADWEAQGNLVPIPNVTAMLISGLEEWYLGTSQNDGAIISQLVLQFADGPAAESWMGMWRSGEMPSITMWGEQASRQPLPTDAPEHEALAYLIPRERTEGGMYELLARHGNVVIWLTAFTEDQRDCSLTPSVELLVALDQAIAGRILP